MNHVVSLCLLSWLQLADFLHAQPAATSEPPASPSPAQNSSITEMSFGGLGFYEFIAIVGGGVVLLIALIIFCVVRRRRIARFNRIYFEHANGEKHTAEEVSPPTDHGSFQGELQ